MDASQLVRLPHELQLSPDQTLLAPGPVRTRILCCEGPRPGAFV